MSSLCMGQDFSEELTCAVCLDSWKEPVELAPCGHIFCKECTVGLTECPVCREKIASSGQPNRTLVNMALQIRVKCVRCGWQGTREQGMRHECGSGPAQPTRPAPLRTQPEPPQHPSAHQTTSPYAPYTYQGAPQQSGGGGGYGSYQSGPAAASNPWQSGAPTQPMPQATPPQQPQNNYQGGYQGGYSSGYPGAAQPPSNNYSPMPPTSGGYAGGYSSSYPQQQQPQQPPTRNSRRYPVIEPSGNYPWTLYDLSQSEYDQIVSLFVFFDEDDSGSLDRKEVGRLARWLNFATTPQDVERIFNDMDADRSGSLSVGEFLSWLRHNKPNPQALYGLTQAQYNTIMMQFHTYDTNQDGCLEMNEFTRLVLNLRDVKDEATARRLFQMIDRDRDGAINLHEFLTFRAGKS